MYCGCFFFSFLLVLDNQTDLLSHATSTKDVTVSKILGSKVANRQARENDFGSGRSDLVEFVVYNVPFGINDGLVFLSANTRSLITRFSKRHKTVSRNLAQSMSTLFRVHVA